MAPLDDAYYRLSTWGGEASLLQHAVTLATASLALYLIYMVGLSIYRIYFHPLAKFPGPRLWAASRIPWVLSSTSGRLHLTTKKLHERYGDVVRVAPDELVFATAQAWKDIYGHRTHGAKQFPKDMMFYNVPPNGTRNLIQSFDDDHTRMRRLLAHAFSDKALREQEPLIQSYVDLLINKLHAQSSPVNMVSWYNWTTFDIIGDLSFGSPFGCLEGGVYHPWVSLMFNNIKANVFLNVPKHFPILKGIKKLFTPASLVKARNDNLLLSSEKVGARLESGVGRPDFLSFILRHNDEKGMTRSEIDSNAALLILAGSETTATLLSGCTYHLLENPDIYQKLVKEIRSSFKNESDITISEVLHLPYLNAVLEESLRIYPPVPNALSRRVPEGGATINGQYVAEGTAVAVHQFATSRLESNFKDAESFVPERWLDDPRYASDNKAAMQPFSMGPRNCLGRNLAYAEMRIILTRVLWNFDLDLLSESAKWSDQLVYILWQKNPLMVNLKPVERT